MTFAERWDNVQFMRKNWSIKYKSSISTDYCFVGLSVVIGRLPLPFRSFIIFYLSWFSSWLIADILGWSNCRDLFCHLLLVCVSNLVPSFYLCAHIFCAYSILLAPLLSKQRVACIYTSCQEDDLLLVYEVPGYVKLENTSQTFFMSNFLLTYIWFWYLLHFMCSRFRML